MPTQLNPYLGFRDTARAAMEFYQGIFGGDLTFSTFAEFGVTEPGEADKIMHSRLETDHGLILMAADTPAAMEYRPGNAMSVSLSGDDGKQLHRYWDELSDGGTVTLPMAAQAWGDEFGMCVDRFGVPWMINISPPQH